MGIEAIGSIGSAMGSVSSGIGKAGAGAAPVVAGLEARFGSVMGPADIGSIVNEGPVARSFLENTMPIQVGSKPVEVINFQAPIKESVVAEVEAFLAQARVQPEPQWVAKPVEVIMPQVEPVVVPMIEPFVAPGGLEYPMPQAVVSPQAVAKSDLAVATQPALQEQEEIVEEKVLTKQDQKNEAEIEEGEDFSESRIKIVEAEKVSDERRKKIRKAVKKAQEEDITVAQALPEGFWDDKSPLVGNGKDWTLDLTAQALEINPNDYQSLEEAEEASIVSVAENIPVKEGEGGRQATIGELRKVTKGEKNMSKPKIPAEIVVRRSIKKRIELAKSGQTLTVLENKVEVSSETTLKDLNLEEVFPKAA